DGLEPDLDLPDLVVEHVDLVAQDEQLLETEIVDPQPVVEELDPRCQEAQRLSQNEPALTGRDGGVRDKDAGSVRSRRLRARPRTQDRALQRVQAARWSLCGSL